MKYFTVLVKPASSLCNMRCGYCFYNDVSDNRDIKSFGIMSTECARNLIDRVFNYLTEKTSINFAFQGGEPTLAGLDFYYLFAEYVKEKNSFGHTINYSIQTNGLKINREWCEFFVKNQFLAGISLDCCEEIHNHNRVDTRLNGTYQKVKNAIALFDDFGVEYNVLSVVTKYFAAHMQEVFDYILKEKIHHIQLIPCLQPLDDNAGRRIDLTPKSYALFLKQFFDLWLNQYKKGNYISIRNFENIISVLSGGRSEQCGMNGRCAPQFVVEANGGVYPCDFYVLDQYYCGNINAESIEQISKSEGIQRFLSNTAPQNTLCRSCEFYQLCGGGCKRYRAFYNSQAGYCPMGDVFKKISEELRAYG